MREAIGGTWLFGIVITFIVLFTSFLAYSISYTKAFNLKNEIINLIEKKDGYTKAKIDVRNATDENLKNDGSVEALAFLKVKNMGYNYSIIDDSQTHAFCNNRRDDNQGAIGCLMPGGYCVYKICTQKDSNSTSLRNKLHYKVTTYIALEIPIINILVRIPISGETKTLYYDASGLSCESVCGYNG